MAEAAHNGHFSIDVAGTVTVEFIRANAGNTNEFYVMNGASPQLLFSTATSNRATRVTLGNYAAGTHFEFRLKSISGGSTNWWSTRQASNSDGRVHARVSQPYSSCLPGTARAYLLSWEDLAGGGDNDFDDMIAVVRVGGDADGDALWDDWERCGIDDDGLTSTAKKTLPGANWQKKDIYVYYNWMNAAPDGHHHKPDALALSTVQNAFAIAPLSNPNGTQGVTMHFEDGGAIAHADAINFNGGPGIVDFDTVKANMFLNPAATSWKRFAYHYLIFAHHHTPGSTSSGLSEIGGNDFIVSLGGWSGNRGTWRDQAGTIMHELGHNLNLGHGGSDGVNYKPNYLSVMNYRYQVLGIPNGMPSVTNYRYDYSRWAKDLNEAAINEQLALWGSTDQTIWKCPGASTKMMPVTNSLDWNCNGAIQNASQQLDVNGDGSKTLLKGYNDWPNILFAFQQSGSQMDGNHPEDQHHHDEVIDLAELNRLIRDLHVGLGARFPDLIKRAYDRAGGREVLGDMIDPAEDLQGTARQNFLAPDESQAAIFHQQDERIGAQLPAYFLKGDLLTAYDRLKGPLGPLGRPTSDLYSNKQGNAQASFEKGLIIYQPAEKRYAQVAFPTRFNGWKAEYFNNPNLLGAPTMVRDEPAIGHLWSDKGAPEGGTIGLIDKSFSVRYSRTLRLDGAQKLRISTATDGGIRVSVDGQTLINGWAAPPTIGSAGTFPEPAWQKRSADVELKAGEHQIVVEFSNRNSDGLGYSALEPGKTQLTLRISDVNAFRNEQPVVLDTAPEIYENRTFLPARFIAESFGLGVEWNGQKRQVTITDTANNKVIVLTIDDRRAYVNGEEHLLDAAPRIVNDRTLIPVRFVTEQIGATVQWDNDTRTVLVTR